MTNKTLLQLTGMRSTKYGALEQYLLELARGCARKGYKTVLQYEAPPASARFREDLRGCGAEVLVSPLLGNPFTCFGRLAGLIRSARPEIVHAHFLGGYMMACVPPLARRHGVRLCVTTPHITLRLRRKLARRLLYSRYDHVLAVSQAVAERMRELGVPPRIVSTHYLGLFGPRTRSAELRAEFRRELAIPEEARVVACIAFDAPVKGLDILFEAFARVVPSEPATHLLLIGVNPATSKLVAVAEALGIADRVHWAGIREQGWRLLNAADVYVQPSRSEALCLAVLEAVALELPTVVSRIGGLSELVQDGKSGYIAEPENAEKLASGLLRLLGEPQRWRAMGQNGRAWNLEHLEGERSVETLIEKYYGL